MVFTIILFRWPFLMCGQQNPDESLELASAITLLSDPVYWRSVAVPTHGPLTTYPLVLPHFLGMRIDFGAAKLVAAVMLVLITTFLYLFARNVFDAKHARIAVFPIVAFVCLMSYDDFVAYNAEYPVLLLMSLELFLLSRVVNCRKGKIGFTLFLSGLVAGCIPFAKIQGLPLAGALVLSGFYMILILSCDKSYKKRAALSYLLGLISVPLIVTAYLVNFDLVHDFLNIYIYSQFYYATSDLTSFSRNVHEFVWGALGANRGAHGYFVFMSALLLFACLGFFVRRCRHKQPAGKSPAEGFALARNVSRENSAGDSLAEYRRWAFASLFLLLLASVAAVYVPGFGYGHYYLLIAFPLGITAGLLSVRHLLHGDRFTRACIGLLLAFSVAGQFVLASDGFRNGRTIEKITQSHLDFRNDPVIETIKGLSGQGDRAAIWGWEHKYYIGARLPMAVRTLPERMIVSKFDKMEEYFMTSYVNELESSKPRLFIDAVAPGQFWMNDRSLHGFQLFPEIRKIIERDYTHVQSVNGVDIYLRREST